MTTRTMPRSSPTTTTGPRCAALYEIGIWSRGGSVFDREAHGYDSWRTGQHVWYDRWQFTHPLVRALDRRDFGAIGRFVREIEADEAAEAP